MLSGVSFSDVVGLQALVKVHIHGQFFGYHHLDCHLKAFPHHVPVLQQSALSPDPVPTDDTGYFRGSTLQLVLSYITRGYNVPCVHCEQPLIRTAQQLQAMAAAKVPTIVLPFAGVV